MNPPPPIPAPEGEVPPRLVVAYDAYFGRSVISADSELMYLQAGRKIEYYVPEAALSAEKQRALRAVEERIDAERWRALLKCERIRILGSAGIGTQAQHLGMEIWDSYPGEHPDASETLTKFADTIRARAAKEPS